MRHTIVVEGYAYKIRPVTLSDAAFIVDVRLEDKERNQYIHEIPNDVSVQEKWIEDYLEQEGEYYFVIENKITGDREGLIAVYHLEDNRAEWGRWVIKKGSMAAVESVDLIYKAAFGKLGLEELFCRTIEKNESVIAFHRAIRQKEREQKEERIEWNGISCRMIEHYIEREYYYNEIQCELEKKAYQIFVRNMRYAVGKFEFHHIGAAAKEIEKEFSYYKLLGYIREGASFEDKEQGIKGQFIISKNQPRLELLENLSDSVTLNVFLENNIHMYHFAYLIENIEKGMEILIRNRAKLVSPLKDSVYFKKRICFFVLANSFLIELIEV